MYSKEIESIKKSNRFRTRELFDENLIDLASNDYLGLSTNKTLFQNAYENVLKENYHSPKASMLVNGYSKIHKKFEDRLCEVNDFEAGVIVGSGFLANISMIEALCRKNDTLFIDEEYHASGILATKLLKPEQVIVFAHNDFKDLEKKISANKRTGRNIIAIEGVYSMGGDLAPIEIFQIADEKKAILIVDEALSVGDSMFQHKCTARMRKKMEIGMTILFVSHSIDQVRALCKKAVWMENGIVKMTGDATELTNLFMNDVFIDHNRIIMEALEEKEE